MDLAIYSKNIITPKGSVEGTLLIEDGRIMDIVPEKVILRDCPLEYVAGSTVMPGLIDPHVHINEPGRTDWEGFEYATKAAAAGGITTLVDMPLNSSPVTTTREAFRQKVKSTNNNLFVNCGFWGGIVPGNDDQIEALLEAGVLGFKAFMIHSGIDEFPAVGEEALRKAMPLLKASDVPLLVHAEVKVPGTSGDLRNPRSYRQYLNSRPQSWEQEAIAQLIGLCREYRCKTHIVHLSASSALPLIRKARAEGLPVTAETCPHYIFFHAEVIPDAHTLFKCAPPIREKDNNQNLWSALKEGAIDFIATDHSPSPLALKFLGPGDFVKAWGGISGLQWSLPVVWTKARQDGIPVEKIASWMAEKTAAFIGMGHRKGKLARGMDADIVIWDPEESFEADPETNFSRHRISPYHRLKFFGKVKKTFVRGKVVFDHGKIMNPPSGELLLR